MAQKLPFRSRLQKLADSGDDSDSEDYGPPTDLDQSALMGGQISGPLAGPIQGMNQYNPLNMTGSFTSPAQSSGIDPNGIMARLAQATNYQTPILDQYRQLLAQGLPDRSLYKPGFGTKLVAGLASLGARNPTEQLQTQESIMDRPYNQAREDYYLRTKMLGEGATAEEKDISNKRQIAYSEARMGLMEQANAIKQEHETFLRDKSNEINQFQYDKLNQAYELVQQRIAYLQDVLKERTATDYDKQQAQLLTQQALSAYRDSMAMIGWARVGVGQENADTQRAREEAYADRMRQLGMPETTINQVLQRDASGNPSATMTIRSRGAYKGVTPQGQPGNTIKMRGPDGNDYDIPADKVPDAILNHMTPSPKPAWQR